VTLTSPEDVNAATAFATPTRIDDRRRKGGKASASHTSTWPDYAPNGRSALNAPEARIGVIPIVAVRQGEPCRLISLGNRRVRKPLPVDRDHARLS
jgi:hypothetical protein